MLMTEGKEVHVFNQSMSQRKNLHKNMISTDKLKDYLVAQGPRLIPRHLQPRCHEMPMQVLHAFPVPVGRAPKSSAATLPGFPPAKKPKTTTKCYYLNEDEAEYLARNFETDDPVPLLPESGRAGLASDPGLDGDQQQSLRLDKWLPWQCSLQPQLKSGHSTLTKNYVDIVGFIQKQQGGWFLNHSKEQQQQQSPSSIHDGSHNNDQGFPMETDEGDAVAFEPNWQCDDDYVSAVPSNHHAADAEDETEHRGLYSPDFLKLFSAACPRCDLLDDVPSPPPFQGPFSFSSENFALPSKPSKCDAGPSSSATSWPPAAHHTPPPVTRKAAPPSLDSTFTAATTSATIPRTPPRTAQEEEDADHFLQPSPILSQRRRRSVKRKLETASPTPAPATAGGGDGKRIKIEPSIEPLRRLDDGTTRAGLPVRGQQHGARLFQNKDDEALSTPAATTCNGNDESILSVTQIIDYVSANAPPSAPPVDRDVVQPNFDLQVDFLLDDSQSQPDEPMAQQENDRSFRCSKNKAQSTPPKSSQQRRPAAASESPVFDFSLNYSPCPTPPSAPKVDFSFNLPDDMDDLGVSALDGSPEAPEAACRTSGVATGAEAKFSLSLPDFSDSEVDGGEVEASSAKTTVAVPLSRADDKTGVEATALQSAWDDGFVLDLDDIEEMNALENAAAAATPGKEKRDNGNVKKNEQSQRSRATVQPPTLAPAAAAAAAPTLSSIKTGTAPARGSDTSRIRQEMEDIFGPEEDESIIHGSPVISKGGAAGASGRQRQPPSPPVVLLIDSDDDILAATPPPSRSAIVTAIGGDTEEEESPMVACRRNPRRLNPLLTQSTPVVPRRRPPPVNDSNADDDFEGEDKRPNVRKTKKKRDAAGQNPFIDYEADLSSVDGHCSEDEADDTTTNADLYQGSFVDDDTTQHVNDEYVTFSFLSFQRPSSFVYFFSFSCVCLAVEAKAPDLITLFVPYAKQFIPSVLLL